MEIIIVIILEICIIILAILILISINKKEETPYITIVPNTKEHKQGVCVKCGSENIDYENMDIDGYIISHEYKCNDCQTHGIEYYEEVFKDNIIYGV